jgi:hypothetical protein
MKKLICFFLLQAICAVAFSENLRLKEWGTPIPARVRLDVRWNAPTNALPPQMWVYHLLPNRFSPEVVSNLMILCSFTDKDRDYSDTNTIRFKNAENSRSLSISFSFGTIQYQTINHFNHTNLAQNVPEENQVLEMATNVLKKFGINTSDIEKEENSAKLKISFINPETMYFVNHTFITNVEFRGVLFQRSVDGASFLGTDTGGEGEIDFGEHGKISKISISWRKLERYKAYPTISPEAMMMQIRKGKAVHGGAPMNFGDFDWLTIKSVTIKKAKPCYYAGEPDTPSDWLWPFAALWATIDTGHGNVDVEIDCPIIDETKP